MLNQVFLVQFANNIINLTIPPKNVKSHLTLIVQWIKSKSKVPQVRNVLLVLKWLKIVITHVPFHKIVLIKLSKKKVNVNTVNYLHNSQQLITNVTPLRLTPNVLKLIKKSLKLMIIITYVNQIIKNWNVLLMHIYQSITYTKVNAFVVLHILANAIFAQELINITN